MATKRPCAVVLLALAACGVHIDRPGDAGHDVVTDAPLAPPTLTPLAPLQPYTVAVIRGSSTASRVRIESLYMGLGADTMPLPATVGTTGLFCANIPLQAPGMYVFHVYADEGGRESAAATVSTTYNPSAPAVFGANTCEQIDPRYCNDAGRCCAPVCTSDPADCGDDGCGTSCHPCGTGLACNQQTRRCCVTTCGARQCGGSDGCGNTCGTCTTPGEACDATGRCTTSACGSNSTCGACTGSSQCGWCTTTNQCLVGSDTGSLDGRCTGPAWKRTVSTCP